MRYGVKVNRAISLGLTLSLAGAAAGIGLWWASPQSRAFRLSRMDLLALNAEVQRQPRDAQGWRYLGTRYLEKGAPEEAAGALQQALSLQPDNPDALVALGRALLAMKEIDRAFQVLKTAEAHAPRSFEGKILLARLYQRTGAYHRAEPAWRAATEIGPRSAEAWSGLAHCYLQMQRVADATVAAQKALSLEPRSADTLRLCASIAAAKGELPTARDYLERGVQVNPEDPRSHHDLANFLLTQARDSEAIARAETAVQDLQRLAPDYALISWHRARLAVLRKDWSTAARELERTLQTEPALDEAHFHLAQVRYRLNDHAAGDKAMAEYRRRSELTRKINELRIRIALADDPSLHFQLARLRRAAGQYELARKSVENGLRLAPASPDGKAELKLLDAIGKRQ